MNNPYKILGISRSANLNIARNKYIKLSKQFHPDVSKYNLEVSENKMKEVNSAYSLIKNSIARGVIAYRPRGRFTKEEIDELIQRFNEGQSLYKIGRDMKRKQRSVKRHLINAGLIGNLHTHPFHVQPDRDLLFLPHFQHEDQVIFPVFNKLYFTKNITSLLTYS